MKKIVGGKSSTLKQKSTSILGKIGKVAVSPCCTQLPVLQVHNGRFQFYITSRSLSVATQEHNNKISGRSTILSCHQFIRSSLSPLPISSKLQVGFGCRIQKRFLENMFVKTDEILLYGETEIRIKSGEIEKMTVFPISRAMLHSTPAAPGMYNLTKQKI